MFYLTCEGNATELLEKAATVLILHFSITRDLEQMLYFLHLLVRLHESNHLWCLWLLIALPLYHIAFECLLVSYFETWFMIVVSYNGCVMTLVKSLYVYLVKLKLHYVKHHFVFQGHVYILRFWACYYDLHPHARFSASQVKSSLTRSAFVELSMSKKCILPSLHTSEDLPFNKRPVSNLSYESY